MSHSHLNSFQVICQKPQGDLLTKIASLDILADNLVKFFFSFVESGRLGSHLTCKSLWALSPFLTPQYLKLSFHCPLVDCPHPSTFTLGQSTDPV